MALPALTQEKLAVKQLKEWGEIVTGWETRNRYQVLSPAGDVLLLAGEVSGGIGSQLLRHFLKNKRPFKLELRDPAGNLVGIIHRPWRWWFSRAELQDADGKPLGAIQQRFAVFSRRYDLEDADGNVFAHLHGPLFRPWTFNILSGAEGSAPVGQIAKKWSGLLKEALSDADNFGLDFPASFEPSQRWVVLAATFLIDFVHFENSQ